MKKIEKLIYAKIQTNENKSRSPTFVLKIKHFHYPALSPLKHWTHVLFHGDSNLCPREGGVVGGTTSDTW